MRMLIYPVPGWYNSWQQESTRNPKERSLAMHQKCAFIFCSEGPLLSESHRPDSIRWRPSSSFNSIYLSNFSSRASSIVYPKVNFQIPIKRTKRQCGKLICRYWKFTKKYDVMRFGLRTQILPMIIFRKIESDNTGIRTLAVDCLLPGSSRMRNTGPFHKGHGPKSFSIGTGNIHVLSSRCWHASWGRRKPKRLPPKKHLMNKKSKPTTFDLWDLIFVSANLLSTINSL